MGLITPCFILLFEGLEHFVGDFFGDVAPDGDDLVVALAVGDGAIEILLLDLDDFVLGGVHQLELDAGDDHVADADGNAGLRGVEEAEFLQPVEHHHGLFEAEAQIAILHQRLDALLLEQAVDERHVRGQVIVEDHAADGGVQELLVQVHRLGVRHVLIVVGVGEVDHLAGVAHADGREQFDFARFERHDDFFGRSRRRGLRPWPWAWPWSCSRCRGPYPASEPQEGSRWPAKGCCAS